jgi:hypothetical protein
MCEKTMYRNTPRIALIEILAAMMHDAWVYWSQNLVKDESVSQERLSRWRTLWVPYQDLPEKHKEADRIWARQLAQLMVPYLDSSVCGNDGINRIAGLPLLGSGGSLRLGHVYPGSDK